jgi:hypothetical protein
LGLHPVVACAVINGGHNDALVGLGLLLAAVDARRERHARAGCWIAAALLVKVTAGLALLPLVAWAWARGGWHAVRRAVAVPLLVAAPLTILTPGVVASLVHGQLGVVSRSSVWGFVLRPPNMLVPVLPHLSGAIVGRLAIVIVVAVCACVARLTLRAVDVAPCIVAGVAAWLVFGGYVLPWYTLWVLPAAALLPNSRTTWIVAVQGAVLTAAWVIPRPTIAAGGYVGDLVRYGAPLTVAALFVWALLTDDGFGTRGQSSPVGWLNRARGSSGMHDVTRRSLHVDGMPVVPQRARVRRPRVAADAAADDE